jgi:putative membrane-bound dehydrogenase-like protein
MNRSILFRLLLLVVLALFRIDIVLAQAPAPPQTTLRSVDPRLEVICFARSPDIVHPIGMTFDHKGRLLVIESHTHFRPEKYTGPKFDRIRILEDTDGDGKADRFTTFFEGTTATMDITAGPDGWIYLSTRNEVLRLRDSKGDGHADVKERIVFLDTKADYPHNALSGLTFDLDGNLLFGMGENYGAGYKLIGADGTTIADEGEGGNIFRCTPDGKNLKRFATGFWNPFSVHVDSFGRIFVVDNDPDSMPPCRMLHVVEGGDYGYQFRYGRSGRHVFQCCDGQIPGTLPMLTGVGEAPCKILTYESDALPSDYFGQLFVTSWADHRLELYSLKGRGASYGAGQKILLQGGQDVRPVGLTIAPDGSLFLTDWVKPDYTLHNQGAVWHVRPKQAANGETRSTNPRQALISRDKPTRDAAALQLSLRDAGRSYLRDQVKEAADPYVRAACLTTLLYRNPDQINLSELAAAEKFAPLQAYLVRAMHRRGEDVRSFLTSTNAALVRVEAIPALNKKEDLPQLLDLLTDVDPFIAHAARMHVAHSPALLERLSSQTLKTPQRIAILLCQRASENPAYPERIPAYLNDKDEEVRFLAAKWVSDQKLTQFKPQVEAELKKRDLNVRMSIAFATALARLSNEEVSETKLAERFIERLQDEKLPASAKAQLLRMIPPNHPGLKVPILQRLLPDSPLPLSKEEAEEGDAALQNEIALTLSLHPKPERFPVLLKLAGNVQLDENARAQAFVGLSDQGQAAQPMLMQRALLERPVLKQEALRSLIGRDFGDLQKQKLQQLADREPALAPMVNRLLGTFKPSGRPAKEDFDGWLTKFGTGGDVNTGRRIFFHPKLAGCYRCHQVDGRGSLFGPDLSTIGRVEPKRILESILLPSATVAPYYQSWTLVTNDGKTLTGMLINTYLDEYTYLDAEGKTFKLKTGDIAETRASAKSIMPEGLLDQLTDREIGDLLAFLFSRK